MAEFILVIDQGTTSTRAILIDRAARVVGKAQHPISQYYPAEGWVEHNPDEIWQSVLIVIRDLIAAEDLAVDKIAAIAITNQRETTLLWDRITGRALNNAIVWQDRRTAARCQALRQDGYEEIVRTHTGLVLDPYFSASKLEWLLGHIPGARISALSGEIAFGTIDSFLLWRLSGGKIHATDITNASRTGLYDIHRQAWDETLLSIYQIPAAVLPTVHSVISEFGSTEPDLLGIEIPIVAVAGDQQAAMIGQACTQPGMRKITYGTGGFLLAHTGNQAAAAPMGLLTTPLYRIGDDIAYGLEGSMFSAGASLTWLQQGLGILKHIGESEGLAASLADNDGVYLVPAFTGLGAPYWDAEARANITGLTRGSGRAHLVRAALEAIAYQTQDLLELINASMPATTMPLRVDGGMSENDWLMQFVADITQLPIETAAVSESTALGAGLLAGIALGWFSGLASLDDIWQLGKRFEPAMHLDQRDRLYQGWHNAVRRSLTQLGNAG